jgi:hypothetical protein
VLEHVARLCRFVFEDDLDPLMQVAGDLEPLADDRGVELDLRKDGGVRMKVDGRTGAARGTIFFSGPIGCPAFEPTARRRLTVATSSFERALTALAPTPCRLPAVL